MPHKEISEMELKSILSNEIVNARTYREELGDFRETATQYYFGQNVSQELSKRINAPHKRTGFSSVVSRDVKEVIDGALPKLMEAFVGSTNVVEWIPRKNKNPEVTEENDRKAKEQTAYANYVFHCKNDGFNLLQSSFKDALLYKNGILKCTWERPEGLEELIIKEGLTEEQYMMLSEEIDQNPDLEITGVNSRSESQMTAMLDQMGNPDPGQPMQQQVDVTYYDVMVVKRLPDQCVIRSLPPEEFLINRDAKTIDSSRFTAHDTLKTQSDLIADGFDYELVNSLPSSEITDIYTEKLYRKQIDYTQDYSPDANRAMRRINIVECYLKIDLDGDGVAELRKITVSGNSSGATDILSNERIDYIPFISFTPIMMTHRFEGISLSEDTFDIQDNKTALQRQLLDNTYLSNLPMKIVKNGAVNLDDLLSPRIGGIIRVEDVNAIQDLTVPNMAGTSLEVIRYWDGVRDTRTGVNNVSSGMNPDVLQNQTAYAVSRIEAAAEAKMALIARNFSNSLKMLFYKILYCANKYSNKKEIIRLTGDYVEVDPRDFDLKLDMTVNVGLGTMDRETKLSFLNQVKADQMQLGTAGSPLVDDEQLFNTYEEITDLLGFKNTTRFFKDPKEQQEGPSEEVIAQVKQQLMQELEVQKMQSDIELANKQLELMKLKIDNEAQKSAVDVSLKAQQQKFDQDKDVDKLETEKQIKSMDLAIENKKVEIARLNAELKNKEIDSQMILETAKLRQGKKSTGNITTRGARDLLP